LLQQKPIWDLVEFGVGVIPGGGGSKELAMRASDLFQKNDVELNVQEYFMLWQKYRLRLTKHLILDFTTR
jgi:3-hydroxyacyl-CoA dehydrogenase